MSSTSDAGLAVREGADVPFVGDGVAKPAAAPACCLRHSISERQRGAGARHAALCRVGARCGARAAGRNALADTAANKIAVDVAAIESNMKVPAKFLLAWRQQLSNRI